MKRLTLLLIIILCHACNHKKVALETADQCKNEYSKQAESEKLNTSCLRGIEYLLKSKASKKAPSFEAFLSMHQEATLKCKENSRSEIEFDACKRGIQMFGKIYSKEHLNLKIGGEINIKYNDNIASDNRSPLKLALKNATIYGDIIIDYTKVKTF